MDGAVHQLRDLDDTYMYTSYIPLDSKNIGREPWKDGKYPHDLLKDFSSFQYPKLGYRQLQQSKVKNAVVAASTARSALRGLRQESIRYDPLPVYNALAMVGDNFSEANAARRLKEIFQPTFTPFTQGLKKLMDGDWPAFAVNEDLAIGLCVSNDRDGWDIYFRGRVVGNITPDGVMNITNKILNRDSIKRKLFG
jgi:hypothetical protein